MKNRDRFSNNTYRTTLFRNHFTASGSRNHNEYTICFVNFLSASRFYYEFTIFFPKSLWINYPRPEINLNSLSSSWISYGFIICFANSPWIHYFFVISICIYYLLREFTIHGFTISLAISLWIHSLFFEFTICFAHSRWIHNLLRNHHDFPIKSLWNHREFTIFFTIALGVHHFFANSPSVSQIFYEFTICFTILLWIHCLFREFTLNPLFSQITMNSLSASQFPFEFTILFPKSLWIHDYCRGFTLNTLFFSRIHYQFREFILNPLSLLRNHYEFAMESLWNHYEINMNSLFFREVTICFATCLWKHYPLHDFTMNSLSFLQTNLEFTIYFVISPWTYYLLSRFHYECAIYFGNWLWIRYLRYCFRKFTLNTLFEIRLLRYYIFWLILWVMYL